MRALRAASAPVLAGCALALFACTEDPGPEPKPGSYLDTLRVLGVQAEPPEIASDGETFVSALVYSPRLYTDELVAFWVFCEPSPDAVLGTKCADAQTAQNPSELIQNFFFERDPAIQVRLLDHLRTRYQPSRNLLEGLNEIDRKRGVTVDVVLVVFESTDLIEVLADLNSGHPSVASVFAMKTIRVAESTDQSNANPVIDAFRVQGKPTEQNTTVLEPGLTRVELSLLPSRDSLQTFTRYLPDGTVLQQKEELSVSWFTTAGYFEEGNETAARTLGANAIHLILNPSVPQQSAAEVYAVLRDGRGGTAWATRTIKVAR